MNEVNEYEKYFIDVNGILYLTYNISKDCVINCDEIEWCGRDSRCETCVFDNENKEFESKKISGFKHIKLDNIKF
ncbi:hypothetical protein [Clostridium sp.]|uniref:hypothetical protein n=1 Tax=Clostridium sp. TaxID=1506 RepID=UPI003F3C3BD3